MGACDPSGLESDTLSQQGHVARCDPVLAPAQWYAHADEGTILPGVTLLGGGGGQYWSVWEEDRNASAAQQVQQPEHREQPQQIEREDGAVADGGQCRVRASMWRLAMWYRQRRI